MTLTGRLTEAKALFTGWISENTELRASAISVPVLVTSKYLPPLAFAMLFNSAVQPGPWPVVTLFTSSV
ncbi:hypothetical protein D9M68_581790 [compost metagenome]